MNLTELKQFVDKLYENKSNHNKKVVVSCGYDDLCYSGEATGISQSIWTEDGGCFEEELSGDEEGESVIEISGWANDYR